MGNCLSSTRTAHFKPKRKLRAVMGRRGIKLGDLPEDVLRRILSKLPVEEAVRTSVLSREWRCLWTGCPMLCFNSRFRCSSWHWEGPQQNTWKFIDRINGVLRQHSGRGVEGLEVKCLFENKLVDHLDNLIRFAMFSRTKNLALDLAPRFQRMSSSQNAYMLPSELFDKESAFCLRSLQVSFVCIKLPSQFLGFSNLRVLELYMFDTTRKDLEDLLCSCCNIERLSMVKCYLQDELTVVRPLPRLQFLQIAECNITKIELHPAELSTFMYIGPCIPIALHHASKLENATVWFPQSFFQQAVTTVLLNGIPEVQRLTLDFKPEQGKPQWMLGSTHMFSRLRHLQLIAKLRPQDNDKMMCLLSFLMVTPVIEKLEIHLHDYPIWFRKSESFRHKVPPCEYKHLKSMYVSGFVAGSFQVEFITLVVENAPVIESVTIDTDRHEVSSVYPQEITPAMRSAAIDMVRGPLLERLPPDAMLLLR